MSDSTDTLDFTKLPEITDADLPELDVSQYPPNAVSDEDRKRFRICVAIARFEMEAEDGPDVWQFARSLYNNPNIPT
jgi:hypothetical protein